MSYTPDTAIHPGKTILFALRNEGISQKNLAMRMGISEKHLSQIINGEASFSVEFAFKLANTLGGSVSFWNNLERNYQETKANIARRQQIRSEIPLLSEYPYNELAKRGYVSKTSDKEAQVENLHRFLSVDSLHYVPKIENTAFRMKGEEQGKGGTIAAWLRCGEIEARKQEVAPFSETKLKQILPQLKELTRLPVGESLSGITSLLNSAGVAIVLIRHFQGTCVSGAFRWVHDVPVIQLSDYYPWADIMWFNLFHEIGHLVLHKKKESFLDFDSVANRLDPIKEAEADAFATEQLIPSREYSRFLQKGDFSLDAIRTFAATLNIDTGIVAGRLCHDKRVHWKKVSQLRPRLPKTM